MFVFYRFWLIMVGGFYFFRRISLDDDFIIIIIIFFNAATRILYIIERNGFFCSPMNFQVNFF